MKQYTAQELYEIFTRIAPQSELLIPIPRNLERVRSGAAVCVYLRYSDVIDGAGDLSAAYWKALRQIPVVEGIGVLASINTILSEHRAGHSDVHHVINERFFQPGILKKVEVAARKIADPAFTGVFTRVGCLQLIRHLLLYGNASLTRDGKNENALGELALLGNDFLQLDPIKNPVHATVQDTMLSFLPVWDIYNPRELAYAMSRMFTILTDILPGSDPEVRTLASRIGIAKSTLKIGRVLLDDFIAAVFGLFAYGRQISSATNRVFDIRKVFANVGFPTGILRKVVRDRAMSVRSLRRKLRGSQPHGRQSFAGELRTRSFLMDSLNIFRQNPLLKLDRNNVLILDLDFLVDLLTSGVYWSIFDSLPKSKRDTFRELWGRIFEIYAGELLEDFYPQASAILVRDVHYANGQIDALLDFAEVVIVLEIKSSLLTETAKRSGRQSEFVRDYERKFVCNEKGKPKALLQLAGACRAIAEGIVTTAITPARIYPICISDEPAVESFFFTTYSNAIFQKEVSSISAVRPVTMMSINELEEILPYVSGNAFSWPELLDFRVNSHSGTFSVHQSIYDLLQRKGLPPQRNQAVRKSFDEVWRTIKARYRVTATS